MSKHCFLDQSRICDEKCRANMGPATLILGVNRSKVAGECGVMLTDCAIMGIFGEIANSIGFIKNEVQSMAETKKPE